MSDSPTPSPIAAPIRVLQLCVLTGAKRSILHYWQRSAKSDPSIQVSAVFIRAPQEFHEVVTWDGPQELELHELVQRARFDPSLVWRLGSLMRKLKPQIVHAHDSLSHLLALILQPVYGFRLVASAYEWSNNSWRKRLSVELAHKLLPGFHRVIAVNSRLARQLCEMGCRPAQVDVVPEVVDTEIFSRHAAGASLRAELHLAPEAKIVGTQGPLADAASLRLLVRAIRSAQAKIGPIHLLLFDPGDLRASAESLALEYGMTQRLHCLRLGSRQAQAYAALDLFVASGDIRELPTAVLEAQSMEVPVIAVRYQGIEPLIEHATTGLVLDDPTAETLGSEIARLLTDRREARALGAAGRLRVCQQSHAADRHRRMARIYRQTLDQV